MSFRLTLVLVSCGKNDIILAATSNTLYIEYWVRCTIRTSFFFSLQIKIPNPRDEERIITAQSLSRNRVERARERADIYKRLVLGSNHINRKELIRRIETNPALVALPDVFSAHRKSPHKLDYLLLLLIYRGEGGPSRKRLGDATGFRGACMLAQKQSRNDCERYSVSSRCYLVVVAR